MLKGIPKILSPDLVKYLMEMGHSDTVVIADGNFPGTTHAKRIVRMDSVEIDTLLEAVLPFYPLDNFVDTPVTLMKNLETEPVPEVWAKYKMIIGDHDEEQAFKEFQYLNRLEFYEQAQDAFLVVQTGDTRRYANIILQKGVC